jgi:glutathione S-transferase
VAAPRLWSWHLSPFAGKVRIAAAVTGTELDLIEIDPVQRPPRLRELNPAGRVPVLEVDGALNSLVDSGVPVVQINRRSRNTAIPAIPAVTADDRRGSPGACASPARN